MPSAPQRTLRCKKRSAKMQSFLYSPKNAVSDGCETIVEVLLVGPWNEGEFADILSSLSASAVWKRSSNCQDAAVLLQETEFTPELILLACPLPDTYSDADVDRLLLAAPLARLVVIAGTWCEGEIRTGTPLAGVLRLYWYELPGWWSSAIQSINADGSPPWSQPMDGSLTGRGASLSDLKISGTIAIDCKAFSTFESLQYSLEPFGAECIWSPRGRVEALPSNLTAGIWDGGQLEPLELERLRTFAREIGNRGGSVIALLDFPRREHLSIVRDAGGSGVMGKPFIVDELVSRIVSSQ